MTSQENNSSITGKMYEKKNLRQDQQDRSFLKISNRLEPGAWTTVGKQISIMEKREEIQRVKVCQNSESSSIEKEKE